MQPDPAEYSEGKKQTGEERFGEKKKISILQNIASAFIHYIYNQILFTH